MTPPLPPETPPSAVLAEEWVRSNEERRRLEAVLWTAMSAVKGLSRSHQQPKPVASGPRYGLDAAQDEAAYRLWVELRGPIRERTLAECEANVNEAGGARPSFRVIVPVRQPDLALLERCVQSVREQRYQNWELCLCDDGSDDARTAQLLDRIAAEDPRVVVVRCFQDTGRAAANDAAERIGSDFVAFLDQHDELPDSALLETAAAIVRQPDADVVYTDEDRISPEGARYEPYFKPDWNPDLLLSGMYVGRLLVVRRSLFESLSGMRPEFEGAQDYDLVLRATEAARRIVHVPSLAYHRRKAADYADARYATESPANAAARRALREALIRRGETAEVETGLCEGSFRVRRALNSEPRVSIVIPFHDGADLLRRCVDSLHATAGYENWEGVLVDNGSWQPETAALRPRFERDERCRLLTYDRPFNWSAINNWAAEQCSGDYLLFLNSDIEGKTPGWLAAMVEHAQREEVGVVGARLLYPDGRVQHAGVVMGLGGGVAWHPFCYLPPGEPGYFGQAMVIRNWTAVTGACLLVRRDVWEEVGRFDERFATAFNDVDFCLRVRQRGYLVVYTPFAELYHHEGATRGVAAQETAEIGEMFRRWEPEIRSDPFFNPNLDPMRNEFALYMGAEEVDPWENALSAVTKSSIDSGKT